MLLKEKSYFWVAFSEIIFIIIGASLEAFAIRFLLLPNNVIDGGAVGIALILSHVSSSSLFGIFLTLITLPFLVMAYRILGKLFLFRMGLAVASLVISNELYSYIPSDFISKNLDSVELMFSGAVVLGVGVGLTLKFGGCVDGTEILAIIIQKTKGISVGTTILFLNIFIYAFAAIVYGHIATGVKSIITYIIASYIMDFVHSGIKDVKMVYIFSNVPETILHEIDSQLRIGSTMLKSSSLRSGGTNTIIMTVVSKMHIPLLKDIIQKEDPKAFFVVFDTAETYNGTLHPVGYIKENAFI